VHPFEYICGEYNHLLAVMLVPCHAAAALAFVVVGGVLASLNHTRFEVPSPQPHLGSTPIHRCKSGASSHVRDFGWENRSRGRFATPADFPLQDCSPYSHVRRESVGFFHRSEDQFYRPVPNPNRPIRNVSIAVAHFRQALQLSSDEHAARAVAPPHRISLLSKDC
jgi:hypothetical protein